MPNKLFDESRVWILDGAMGTMLQQAGLAPGEIPDVWSVTHPEVVTGIHKAYLEAGSNFISTNTFGANGKKLAGCGYTVAQVVTAAVQCAKKAAEGTDAKILLDIGPLGEMLQPMGTLPFEQACDLFKEVVAAGAAAGADAVYFETMTDLLEVKAGILAAKETCDLPVMASMTFEATGRTFTGCQVESFAVTAQGLGADAVGINCSLGPAEILPLVERLCAAFDGERPADEIGEDVMLLALFLKKTGVLKGRVDAETYRKIAVKLREGRKLPKNKAAFELIDYVEEIWLLLMTAAT